MEANNKHILIVDDNLKNLQFTGKILQDEGYLISVAHDASTALGLFNTHIPNLILLDIMMPGMDGLELCRKIKLNEQLRDIPIIFLTAKSQTEDLVEGFEAGGVDYITKPFRREELLVRVMNHLELASSRKKIMEMNRNRDKLYSIIAHDIRSPLSSILFMVSAIKADIIAPGSSDYNEMLESLEKTTSETTTLLNNLLAWTKVQSETINLAPKVTNVFTVLMECVALLKANADQKNISIIVDVPESFTAYFDEVTMHTAFRNIISNAIKFTPPKGSIEISSHISQGRLNITFKDSGVGMPQQIIDKIFVHNEHHTTLGTAKEQGSGLGLVMVKDFVQKNRGTLNITSQEGKGTEISITLPLGKPLE